MKIKVWGCRGSLASPGIENEKYGGNTSCVEVNYKDRLIILDGGSGIRRLGKQVDKRIKQMDIVLTHLHLDHIIGLGFFGPFYNPDVQITIWGPAASDLSLEQRLGRYFSPPLSPLHLKEFPCQIQINELNQSEFMLDELKIKSDYICHPGATLGFRLETSKAVFTYLPDHEPLLGSVDFPNQPEWTSGYELAENADLLIHDAQYTEEEYEHRIGWGHSTFSTAVQFADMCRVKKVLISHHDPSRSDLELELMLNQTVQTLKPKSEVELCAEGNTYILPD